MMQNNVDVCPFLDTYGCPYNTNKDIVLDVSGCTVTKGDKAVVLRETGAIIFQMLYKRFGRVVSKDALLQGMYGMLPDADMPNDPINVLRVQICYLRREISFVGLLIRCAGGIGYALHNGK